MEADISSMKPPSRKKPTVTQTRDPPRAVLLQQQKKVMSEPGFNKDELRPFGSLARKKKIADTDGDDPMDEDENPESLATFVEEGAESEGEEDFAERERELAKELGDAAGIKHPALTTNRTTVVQCLLLVQQWISKTPLGSIPIHGRIVTMYNEDARGDTRDHPGAKRMRHLMDQVHAQLAGEILHPKGSPLQRSLWAAAARPPYPIEVDTKYRKPLTLVAYEKLLMEHLSVKIMGTITIKELPGMVLLVGQWYIEGVMFSIALLLEPAAVVVINPLPVKSRNPTTTDVVMEEATSPVYEEPYTFRAVRDFRNTPDEGVEDHSPVFQEGAPTFWYISYTFVDTAVAEAAGEVLLADPQL